MFKFVVIGIASLLLVSSATIIAADEKPVKIKREIICYPLDSLIASLKKQYGEEPMVMGLVNKEKGIGMGLYINKETGTYTVIEFTKGAACILSTGENVGYRFPTHPGTSL
jgi:DNA/RNA endonuclease YhcR with UshA esterase domain